jgi:hypothetical protein
MRIHVFIYRSERNIVFGEEQPIAEHTKKKSSGKIRWIKKMH